MGNKIARTTQVSASEYYLHDLPSSYNLVLKEVLGRGRFFKSIQCKHDEGLVLVKVYFKRGDSIDLREYERRLFHIKETFRALDHPHLWPFQFWQETDKAAYLVRQYFFNNLHDRLSTRPFLSLIEKKWLAFQLLLAVKQCHDKGICHGDIKCENVLVTSWNWLYLADFASFKPTYIPYDDPSDFSFFYDTGGRRLCYLAPERFYEHGGEMQVAQDAPLRPSMDIFAVGCVIAELFLEGQPLFELSQLLAYRRGQYDPSQLLEKIPDCGIRKMILHMIQLEPELRLSADSYLQEYTTIVFPSYFSPFLHNFHCFWNPLHSDMRVALCQSVFPEILKQMMSNRSSQDTSTGHGTPSNIHAVSGKSSQDMIAMQNMNLTKGSPGKKVEMDKGFKRDQFELLGDINTLLRDVKQSNHYSNMKPMVEDNTNSAFSQNLGNYGMQSPGELLQTISHAFRRNDHPFLKKITMNDLNSLMSKYDSQSDTFGMPFLPLPEDSLRCEGMVLITSLLCSCIRNVKLPHLRRRAILLLKSSALYIDDENRLQRVIPYVVAMLSDQAAIVRCAALETLCDILPLVRDFPPSDAKIFPEYILPMLSMLPDDTEESVRICYASNIAKLALTAYGFLVHSITLSEAGVLDELSSPKKLLASSSETSGQLHKVNNDAQLAQLRKSIAEVIQELVMGPKQTPNIRRALLQDISNLCCFFGQRQSNDFLLPILPAFLNDRDEQLRAVFYGQIVYVCFFVGQRSVEEYLLPYIEQAVSDATEAVIVNALDCLAILCKSGYLRKRILLEMIERSFPLLCYPSQWVRRSAVSFIAASSDCLGAVDSYVFLAPVIRPLLRRQPASLASEKALLSCLKPPVSRQVFYQVLENARSSDMLERQRKIWYNSWPQSKQWESVDLLHKGVVELNSMRSWTDDQESPEGQKHSGNDLQQGKLTECDDGEAKFGCMGSFTRNGSSTVDIHDPLSSEKLQYSGFMWPQGSTVNSFMCDKSSVGIPLYSFSMDRRAVGVPPAPSDSSLQVSSVGVGASSMPWMDPVNKSFSLASSVPAPKLVSGSFNISSGSKQFYRVVHEPDGRDNDQTTFVNSKFQDMGLSSATKASSITVEDASSTSDLTGLPSSTRASSIPDSGWRPRGVLVAHLQEHRSAVNDIAVSTDHSFFVSASDDSTVKVWDSRKLEKDISFRSRLTYHMEGSRALCSVMLRGCAQVVVGACDGMIHMFSVDYISRGLGNVVEKYSGVADIKKKDTKEGAILSLLNFSADNYANQMVMYSTQNCGIHLWDIRTNSDSWTLKATPEEGYVSSLVTGPCENWFVSGSSRGVLTLWDMRFLIPVNTWQYSAVCPIEKMCLFLPPPNASVSAAARPLVYVAAGCNEVSLWNAENGTCHQVLRVASYESDAEMSEVPWALARSSTKNSKADMRRNVNPHYRVDELNEPPPRIPGIRSLLPLPGGDLLTGGTDLKIRRWDHYSPDRSYCICGPNLKGVGNDDFYGMRSSFGVQVVQETKRRPLTTKLTAKAVLAAAATDTAGCHRDSILSLASVKLNQRHLISSSRDGAIKVWK
ncbi:putative transferase, protein kinase CMGC-Pl-Tthe family [Rosa chinensis]|uniref:non-specific serine/threonine protein kinase n=1 Tax=Rosa chinensis TaxID=74649 RepID=A0A2P6SBM7_ROSCH|nr:serine/threonine-protein kinase VPS15 [Rosa chinensis]PRQ56059.1 putative transferase, protein kinase CMGC-Pl-Tthe family [Rosa chinensis]